jgi:diguanylate cyclase (GGDEF)-like protein/PAS domain S-box-containing protein
MTEAAYVPSLQAFAQAFAGSGAVMLMSRVDDSRIVAISPNFLQLLGITEAEAIGQTSVGLGLWRDDQSRRAVLALLKKDGVAAAQPVSLRNRRGEYYDGLMNCCVVEFNGDPYLYTLVLDLRRYDSELDARAREMDSYRTLAMETAVGLYRRRCSDGQLIEANVALARLLGYRDVDPLLSSARPVPSFPYLDPAKGSQLQVQLDQQGGFRNERAQWTQRDGGTVWVSESARLVRGDDGKPLYIEGTVLDIGDLVQTETALQQSETLYRHLVENSRDGVFLMQHGRVIIANETLGEILGYRKEELIGANYFDWVAPEDLAAQQQRKLARESGSTDTQLYEIHLIRRDGSRRLCAVRAGAVEYCGEPASIGTLRDISEERAQQRRLQEAEERYRLLFRHAVLGMFQSSLEGRLIEVNEAMASMFGFDSPEQMQREVQNMRDWYADASVRDQSLGEITDKGQIVAQEFELLRRDGGSFWALASARLVREEGKPSLLEGSLLDNSARRQAEQELKFLAHHDALTALDNRRRFEQRLEQALAGLREQPTQTRAVLLLDLDRFKLVNDSLGHAAGDQLLVEFARRLREALADQTWIARYGGDEFALLSRHPVDDAGIEAITRRIHAILEAPFRVRGHQVFTSASIGVVLLQNGELEPEDVLRDADTAMFRAKASGGGCHALFDNAMHSAARARLALETELRFALERKELTPYFQPIVQVADGRIVGVETLVRWRHPQRGLLLPADFLEVAEEAGMLPAIDLSMLEQALLQFAGWQRSHPAAAPQRLSVNISNRLFVATDFPRLLEEMLGISGIAPEQLHVEITETVFRGQAGTMRETLASLKRLGVRLVVDDFGTGYSSLVSFSESAFDGLKVDRGFIGDLDSNPRHRAIVRTITQFARDLNLSLVAEGVESRQQADLLLELGCELAQGFLYAPALPAAELARRLGAA